MADVFLCGGKPTPKDLATVQDFSAALAQPTKHLQALAMLEMGDSEEDVAAVAEHERRCCSECGHRSPHVGCILR